MPNWIYNFILSLPLYLSLCVCVCLFFNVATIYVHIIIMKVFVRFYLISSLIFFCVVVGAVVIHSLHLAVCYLFQPYGGDTMHKCWNKHVPMIRFSCFSHCLFIVFIVAVVVVVIVVIITLISWDDVVYLALSGCHS